ncbi:porin family protein [Rhodobacteraceae bacterium RKSG542]|uniref:outer membrane protein n=1 Tax=Pseudovibrio flavus TaxID=2529854 RepID=UPI0012BBB57C|nr:outer membrane beta-barrel protein [Pseudovibrio flavus]MTI18151.1 porin family protein [Pseudovibrio flavus]
MLKYFVAACMLVAPTTTVADEFGSWDGVHLGLKGGLGSISGKDSLGNTRSLESGIGGAFAGYTVSIDQFVFGVEADVTASNFTAVSSSGFTRSHAKWSATSTVRVGYDAGNFLPYLSAGVGLAGYEVRRFDDGQKASNTHVGFAVGGGLETKLTDNVTARVDYKHLKMSKEEYDFNGYPPFSIEGHQNQVSLGIAYKF